ncbi:MAG TPA: pantoate--beta-alanine ligase [Bacteroidia bacterium]|nr:pantoate--beta-alanine ligase [Bacteroidia bacterium]
MKVARSIAELNLILDPFRAKKAPVGFVPTMGALHEGHLSLITRAKTDNAVVVCSIFVNPTQFNDPKDLERYPRPIEEDKRMLESAGCDVLFLPTVEEMYPDDDYSTLKDDFGTLDKVMEGISRPGHFAGMITIVNKLFMAVMPQNAYFGQKDFQQLSIVKRFIEMHHVPINIIACPIVREADGLAMSSRNRLLNPEERKRAVLISKTLFKVKDMWGKTPIADIKKFVENEFTGDGYLKLIYFEIADTKTLQPVTDTTKPAVACVAVFDGKIRLIDNVLLNT